MSLLSSLTDAFTGQPYKDAAAQQRNYLSGLSTQVGQNVNTAQQQGLDALRSGTYGATGAITGGVNTARGDISGSTIPAINALYGGTAAGANALTGSMDPALAALLGGTGAAAGAYDPLSSLAGQYAGYTGQASQATADALGLNGPEGVARAQQSFQAGPGFQFALGQGLDAITRAQNAVGMGASGNTLRESQTFGQGLANQEWQKYLDNLRQREGLYAPLALSGTGTAAGGRANALLAGGTGAANIYTGTGTRLADLLSGTGKTGAGIFTGEGQSLADLASRGGLAAGNVLQQGGQTQADLIARLLGIGTGFTQNIATPYASTYGAEAAAQMGGSNNLWNLIGGAAKAAAGAPTGTFSSLLPASGGGSSYLPYPRFGG